jgi:hypothetical protein
LAFDEVVDKKLGYSMTKDDFKDDPDFADSETPTYDTYEDEEGPASKMPHIYDIDDVDTYDQYVGAQVGVPIGDETRSGKFVRRKRELDDTVKG